LFVRDDRQQAHHVVYQAIDATVFEGTEVVGFAGEGS
jgi:hypothetical protein